MATLLDKQISSGDMSAGQPMTEMRKEDSFLCWRSKPETIRLFHISDRTRGYILITKLEKICKHLYWVECLSLSRMSVTNP